MLLDVLFSFGYSFVAPSAPVGVLPLSPVKIDAGNSMAGHQLEVYLPISVLPKNVKTSSVTLSSPNISTTLLLLVLPHFFSNSSKKMARSLVRVPSLSPMKVGVGDSVTGHQLIMHMGSLLG